MDGERVRTSPGRERGGGEGDTNSRLLSSSVAGTTSAAVQLQRGLAC